MFAKHSIFGALRSVAPAPRKPRLEHSSQHHRWSVRHAALGVEIRGTSLYLACVRPGWNQRWLSATWTISDFPQLTGEQLRQRIREALAPLGVDDPVVVLGIPRRETTVRHLQLPIAAEKSLDKVLDLQLGLYKPCDEEEFCWDAAVVHQKESLAISLAFAPRARVQEVVERLADAGYPVSRVSAAQLSTLDWVLRSADAATSPRLLIVQSHGTEAEFAIVENKACVYSRPVTLPSDDDEAAAQCMVTQIRQALATLRSNSTEACTVVLAGPGTEHWRGVLAEFGSVEHIGRFCSAEGLLTAAEVNPAALEDFWGAIALALDGLSWTGDYRLNLLPTELRPTRRHWQNAPIYALLVVNVLLLAALAARAPLQREVTLKRYQQEISGIERPASQVERQVKKEKQIGARLDALRQFQQDGRRPLDALSDIAQKLPPDAWVNSFSYRQGEVGLIGTAKSAAALLPALKTSPDLQDVEFRGALTRESTGAERFQMQIKLRASR
jgi:Tfp pilus assembly protein PilN